MAFRVLEGEGRTFWAAGDGASTYYKGQIVSFTAASKAQTNGTVLPLAVPAGAGDLTNFQIPAGIVMAFNNRTPLTTTLGSKTVEYGGGTCITKAAQVARDWTGQEGMYSKADPQVLLQITEILPSTMLRGLICNAAYGTAPTVLTNTGTDTTGGTTAFATNACDFTNVNLCGTIYCRTGTNAGLYRISKDTSTTAPSVNTAFPYNIAVGDTFVRVPLKQGASTIYIGGPGMYIDCSKNPVIAGTDLFSAMVYKLDLSTAGKETADFRFGALHFLQWRA
jgi:hypothetical protein